MPPNKPIMLNFWSSKNASALSKSEEYCSFRSSIPQKKVVVDEDQQKVWTLYDAGPQHISCPLVCLPPVSCSADVFFKQILGLSTKGYRVIAVHYPIYWTMREWCTGFQRLLDHLNLDKIHVFGASLGGFLAQKYCEQSAHCPRIQSLILCNSFTDTAIFNYTDSAVMFWMTPSIILKKMIMGNFSKKHLEPKIADSVAFVIEKLEGLSQPELASRLTLNCMNCYVQPHKLQEIAITIVDVFDEGALSQTAREEMYKFYPHAKRAHLKSGGNFPYLSRSEEVNLHIQVHLRQFSHTKYRAHDESMESENQETSSPTCSLATDACIFERSL